MSRHRSSPRSAFNFFHTQPYYSLRISDRFDIITTVLLAVVGLAVGEIAVLSHRHEVVADEHATGAAASRTGRRLVASGADQDEVWDAVRTGLIAEMGLASVSLRPGDGAEPPAADRARRTCLLEGERYFTGGGFAFRRGRRDPRRAQGATLGRLVLEPAGRRAVSRDQRRVRIALADQLAVVRRRGRRCTRWGDGLHPEPMVGIPNSHGEEG